MRPEILIAEEIRAALGAKVISREERARRIAEAICNHGNYRWLGIYDVGAEEIAAIAWAGPEAPAFPRFPVSKGLCGAAVKWGKTVVVSDVASDPRYLTTLGSTKSEIVVPVKNADKVVGLIDAESEKSNAFAEKDRELLERCALALGPLWL